MSRHQAFALAPVRAHGVPVYLYTLAASLADHVFPECLLVVYQCTRTGSPHPPHWPDHWFPCQHNLSIFEMFSGTFRVTSWQNGCQMSETGDECMTREEDAASEYGCTGTP